MKDNEEREKIYNSSNVHEGFVPGIILLNDWYIKYLKT